MAYLQDFYPETTAEVYPAESSDRGSGSSKQVDQPRGVPVFEALVWTLCRIASIAAAVLVARLTDDESGSISTTAWADSVCTSLSDWRSSINSLADVSGGPLTPESLREKLGEADTATEQLVTELKDLGPPDLEAGKDVEQALDDSAAGLQASYESLKAGVQAAADADTPAAFLRRWLRSPPISRTC